MPNATYRVQFHPEWMTLENARRLIPYWAALGVSHLYASPLAVAKRGSTHGYDVTDPNRVNPRLGGEDALAELSAALKGEGMGLILDIVPHHMAAHPENRWWNDVLRWGPRARSAGMFDIRWEHERRGWRGRLVLPVLARPYAQELTAGSFQLEVGRRGPVLRYGGLVLPLHPSTWDAAVSLHGHMERLRRREGGAGGMGNDGTGGRGGGSAAAGDASWLLPQWHDLLARQPYVLTEWRAASDEGNYRRFFAVNELVALRMEDVRVFRAYHKGVVAWAERGWIQGLRIDHVDGLYDPRHYLQRLHRALPYTARYIIVEKITAPEERLPEGWPVHGTSGYDFLNVMQRALVDWEGFAQLEEAYRNFTGADETFADLVYRLKKQVVRRLFGAMVRGLVRRLEGIAAFDPLGQDLTRQQLETALVETTASLSVYRTYIRPGSVASVDRARIEEAIAEARRRRPDADARAFRFLRNVLLPERDTPWPTRAKRARSRAAMVWQQLTGPVMAKGVEDTALYRYEPLLALNEVGGHPVAPQNGYGIGRNPGYEPSVDAWHRLHETRDNRHRGSFNATSTHDTKRSEDVRSRLTVIADVPRWWIDRWAKWHRMNASHGIEAIGRGREVLLYQTLLGAWPLEDLGWDAAEERNGTGAADGAPVPREFYERVDAYMLKAVREASEHTSWDRPNGAYERDLSLVLRRLLIESAGRDFRTDMRRACRTIAPAGAIYSLAQVTGKATTPGVPDIYQGNELWDFSLVDPDNRRPVHFALRQRLLHEIRSDEAAMPREHLARRMLDEWVDGRLKLYVTYRLLGARKGYPDVFAEGDYIRLRADGEAGGHVLVWARRGREGWVLVALPRRLGRGVNGTGRPQSPKSVADVWAEGLGDSSISLPTGSPRRWRHLFTGDELVIEVEGFHRGRGPHVGTQAVFEPFPVAVWMGLSS